jgi:L-ascorbate metabolism protein UlaG (beta-lactamase superfamily)
MQIRRILRPVGIFTAVALLGFGLYIGYGYVHRPGLALYEARLSGSALPARAPAEQVTVTWFGTTTLLLSDGETALLTDGFFTRPGGWFTLARGGVIAPDRAEIDRWVDKLGPIKPAAILVSHSHHDHAMDSALVAERTSATVVGSTSTANIARGHGLGQAQIRVVVPFERMSFGRFGVTFIASRHGGNAPMDTAAPFEVETVDQPLRAPAKVTDYKDGGTYSILVQHPLGNVLIHGSAGFIPGHLRGVKADVVFLGIGGLGRYPREKKARYWRETVGMVGATKVVPIHFDDFTLRLEEPLRPFPSFYDDFQSSMEFLIEQAGAAPSVALETLAIARPTVLFPGR